jgi:fatty-acyl-CoA synthase
VEDLRRTTDICGFSVKIAGRIKDMIIRGGENIFPTEIEGFLHRHEAVEDVQVIGVPSEQYGEEVMTFVRRRTGMQVARRTCLNTAGALSRRTRSPSTGNPWMITR